MTASSYPLILKRRLHLLNARYSRWMRVFAVTVLVLSVVLVVLAFSLIEGDSVGAARRDLLERVMRELGGNPLLLTAIVALPLALLWLYQLVRHERLVIDDKGLEYRSAFRGALSFFMLPGPTGGWNGRKSSPRACERRAPGPRRCRGGASGSRLRTGNRFGWHRTTGTPRATGRDFPRVNWCKETCSISRAALGRSEQTDVLARNFRLGSLSNELGFNPQQRLMQRYVETARRRPVGIGEVVSQHRVLRNTYMLLSLTLLFSGGMAGVSMALNLPYFGLLITLGGYFGLLFLTYYLRNSIWGIASVFALTGFMGLTLGPMLSAYLQVFSNGGQLIAMSLGGTGAIFLGLSGYALTTKRDFTGWGSFLMVGIVVMFLLGLGAYFFQMPALSLAVSAGFMLLMGGLILFETQQIIRGGETNYILATVTLYVSIYNLFVSLLHLLGAFMGED